MHTEPTRIENLPNELLLDIFSFIRPKDLLQGWYNLNSYINSILHSTPIGIKIKNQDDFDDARPVLKQFCSQIFYLKDERLLPLTRIDVHSLTNIRYLYLGQCTKEQYEQIHPNSHSHLTYFYSLSVPWTAFERILFGPTRFPQLTSIGYPRGSSILLMNSSCAINTTIRHLHLQSASSEIVQKYIQYLPHITSLTIDNIVETIASSTSLCTKCYITRLSIAHVLSSQFHFEQFIASIEFPDLIQLRISLKTCDFRQLANVLIKLASLKHFILTVDTFSSNLNLSSTRLMSPWFSSLKFESVSVDKYKVKQVLAIKTSTSE